jgi:hypothetical protein
MFELLNDNKTLKMRKSLFWDVNPLKLDALTSKKLIIERVSTRGTLTEWQQLNCFYSYDELKSTLLKVNSLDKRTLNFVAQWLHTDKTEFACYKKRQLAQTYWNL